MITKYWIEFEWLIWERTDEEYGNGCCKLNWTLMNDECSKISFILDNGKSIFWIDKRERWNGRDWRLFRWHSINVNERRLIKSSRETGDVIRTKETIWFGE